ncbi:hypothetical protein PISMIDRAFT_166468 [Pisolithus microcarpus 441]|uniref:Unplaced genomic scaffold scaffold_11, whole genome shotgun sequence n=1 Tax=Pisolithus microcarpus 441 TaxID=765257 RepID=A0A0C9ZEF3_9AGAM|nr:hypothetical protein PISMIDRAFT_166468 [Pisolithus microcarpus 441]
MSLPIVRRQPTVVSTQTVRDVSSLMKCTDVLDHLREENGVGKQDGSSGTNLCSRLQITEIPQSTDQVGAWLHASVYSECAIIAWHGTCRVQAGKQGSTSSDRTPKAAVEQADAPVGVLACTSVDGDRLTVIMAITCDR